MRVYRELLITVLFLSSLLIIPSTTSVRSRFSISTSGAIGLDWLRTDGRWIVDSEGNIISWRGVNIFDPRKRSLMGEDYGKMASWGVKTVRMPIEWHQIEPQPRTYDLSYLEYVDNQITWAKKYGIRVVLDMHHWYWSPHFTFFSNTSGKGYGMPVWLVGGYPDTECGWLDAITDFWLGKGPNATESSLHNPSMMDRCIFIWKFLASRYANESTIAMFDLFNEPPRGQLTHWEHAQYLYPFYEKLISEIRKVDSNHILNYQPTWGWATQHARLLNDRNIAFSFHFYRLKDNYEGNSSAIESSFTDMWSPVEDWNIPVWVSEVGIELFRPNFDLWANNILSILAKHKVGWTWYVYSRGYSEGYFLLDPDGKEKTELTTIVKAHLQE